MVDQGSFKRLDSSGNTLESLQASPTRYRGKLSISFGSSVIMLLFPLTLWHPIQYLHHNSLKPADIILGRHGILDLLDLISLISLAISDCYNVCSCACHLPLELPNISFHMSYICINFR